MCCIVMMGRQIAWMFPTFFSVRISVSHVYRYISEFAFVPKIFLSFLSAANQMGPICLCVSICGSYVLVHSRATLCTIDLCLNVM